MWLIELEDEDQLSVWYDALSDLWRQTGRTLDYNLCPYSLSEIERELIRRDNIKQEIE